MNEIILKQYLQSVEIQQERKERRKHLEDDLRKKAFKLMVEDMTKAKGINRPFKVSNWNLYGISAHIHFYDEFQGERATLKDIKELLQQLPPTKAFWVRDGCLSRRPEAHTEKDSEEINPVIIHFDGFHDDYKIKWFHELAEGLKVEVFVRTTGSTLKDYVSVSYRRALRRGYTTIEDERAFSIAQPYEVVKWSRGSQDYPHDRTFYLTDIKEDMFPEVTQ